MGAYLLGIDVGSTTAKLAVLEPQSKRLLYTSYKRHYAEQKACIVDLLRELAPFFPEAEFKVSFCGSGAKPIADHIGCAFVQEVVANAIALKELHPNARTAIELGGQDAKLLFFYFDEYSKQLLASDMRMNGVCAGGTGAFIDEIADLLRIPVAEFNDYACQATEVFHVSGRCGVFAKTDIQPLLNQGIGKADLALSTFHAVARQTIGGLAQGNTLKAPIVFEGGPLTFNPKLIEVFAEHLNLATDEIIVPEKPETIVAYGCALATDKLLEGKVPSFSLDDLQARLANPLSQPKDETPAVPFFESEIELETFRERHRLLEPPKHLSTNQKQLNVYLGIDSGSTTSKFVLLDEDGKLVYSFYGNNQGQPLDVLQHALIELREQSKHLGTEINILGLGTTGYGEELSAAAFHADYHTVETVAHAKAALSYQPDASFVLDIGGQDMKAMFIHDGIITAITLNEACSSGCGAFIETFANSLEVPVSEIANHAFKSQTPAQLGSRCTVFMRSKVISEQKNGKTPDDILAGLCKSVIQNVFTKVIRISNLDTLGEHIVVQGGTFRNDAILRAMELHSQKTITRSPYPELMGAIGIALLARDHKPKGPSQFIGLAALEDFSYQEESGQICPFCANHCNRSIIYFADGRHYVQGNRCERGEIIGDLKDKDVQSKVRSATQRINSVANLVEERERLLLKAYPLEPLCEDRKLSIGIPLALETWIHLPFWRSFFSALGFKVKVSEKSSYAQYERAISTIPSDTVCFPAKLAHGHLLDLLKQGVDRIFSPVVLNDLPQRSDLAEDYTCSVLHGYPLVLKANLNIKIPFDTPTFIWKNTTMKHAQLAQYMKQFGITETLTGQAIRLADEAQAHFQTSLEARAKTVLAELEGSERFAVVLAMRPYHTDHLINHDVARYFTRLGIPVLPADALPDLAKTDLGHLKVQVYSNIQAKIYAATTQAAQHPRLELAQIVSFGCGHDAIMSDEIRRIMQSNGKEALILKLDESDVKGPLRIRISSFVNTVKDRRANNPVLAKHEGISLPVATFKKQDRTLRTIYIPNLSEGFSELLSTVLKSRGFKVKVLPLADERAIELGKMYLNNDICFPAQLNVGECLRFLETEQPDSRTIAFGMHQNCKDCRSGQYIMLLRKVLDDKGYADIPLVSSGDELKELHPGFSLDTIAKYKIIWGLIILEALEDLRRSARAYETTPGSADDLYLRVKAQFFSALEQGIRPALASLKQAVNLFHKLSVDRSKPKPVVMVLGEILVASHPKANYEIERYLEANGMEVIISRLSDHFHRGFLEGLAQSDHYFMQRPFLANLFDKLADKIFDTADQRVAKIMQAYPHYRPRPGAKEIYAQTKSYLELMHVCGEGWLIPGEIMHAAQHGVENFVVVQPFGCLPAHIYARGMIHTVKSYYPKLQILPLDFDPDTSLGNVENRLQMLIMNARASRQLEPPKITAHPINSRLNPPS